MQAWFTVSRMSAKLLFSSEQIFLIQCERRWERNEKLGVAIPGLVTKIVITKKKPGMIRWKIAYTTYDELKAVPSFLLLRTPFHHSSRENTLCALLFPFCLFVIFFFAYYFFSAALISTLRFWEVRDCGIWVGRENGGPTLRLTWRKKVIAVFGHHC